MTIETKMKSFELQSIKMLEDAEEPGTFEGIISVFGNVDSYGDMMMPGSFVKSLVEWALSDRRIPILWAHKTDLPAIGVVLEAKEVPGSQGTPPGLWVKGRLFLGDSERAGEIHAGMVAKVQSEFSFGYQEISATDHTDDRGEFTHRAVHEVRLLEVSPVFRGANPDTYLIDAKSEPEGSDSGNAEGGPNPGLMLLELGLLELDTLGR